MTELCDQYGVSRKTGYKWVARYEADGRAGLNDRSRRPHHSPRATDPEIVERLCEARRRHPTWSARKLIAVLRRHHPEVAWPAPLDRLRLAEGAPVGPRASAPRSRRVRRPAALAPITRPNEVWTTDFKGEFRTGDGVYCYPLTLRDGFSRYVLRCDALRRPSVRDVVRDRFERAFAEYGLPDRIRSDNGGAVCRDRASTRLTRLVGLVDAPGHSAGADRPRPSGAEWIARAIPPRAESGNHPAPRRPIASAQQQRFRRFCAEYNEERPHEALR